MVAEVLRHHPEIAGVLLERPGMLELAKGYFSQQGVADRCELVEGDFSSIPAGGDVYLLKSILHDWDDDQCVAILRNCRAAMDEASRLVIVELILPQRMTPSAPLLSAGTARPDHAGLCRCPRAHRGRVHAASRSGEPPPGEQHRADGRAARPRNRRRIRRESGSPTGTLKL